MKITLSVEVINRLAHSKGFRGDSKVGRRCKTVVQVRWNPDGSGRLVLSNMKAIIAHQYSVKSIQKLRTHCIQDGLATIEISDPPMNILMRSDKPAELKQFMDFLATAKSGKPENNQKAVLGTSSGGNSNDSGVANDNEAAGSSRKGVGMKRARSPELSKVEKGNIKRILNGADKVVNVRSRKNYPKEFPKTLERVTIQEIGLKKLDQRILRLDSLTSLDLKGNSIKNVDALMHLRGKLRILDLSGNEISALVDDFFESPAFSCLIKLDISKNKLVKLPPSLTNLQMLQHLIIRDNQIVYLPYNFKDMTGLKNLSASNNQLGFVPYPIISLQLTSLDVSDNPNMISENLSKTDYVGYSCVPSLFEISCENLMKETRNKRQSMCTGLPPIVSQYLRAGKCCFLCGKLSLRYKIQTYSAIPDMPTCLLSPARTSCVIKKIICYACDHQPISRRSSGYSYPRIILRRQHHIGGFYF